MKTLLKLGILFAMGMLAGAAAAQNYQVNLSWTAPAAASGITITNYAVYRAVHGSSSYTQVNSAAAASTAAAYTDTTVLNGTSYDYYIETVATSSGVAGIQSAPSAVLTIAIPSTVVLPPTSPSGTITGQQIALTVDTKTNTITAKLTMIEGPTKIVKTASK